MVENWVRIVDLPEAGDYAGRVGHVNGRSSLSGAPDRARGGPVVGVHVGGSAKTDLVYGVWFEDTNESVWFSPHLLERIDQPP